MMCVSACVHACVYLLSRLVITNGMIWTQYDWLNEFFSFYMTATVNIISRCGLTIEVHRTNQPDNKLVLCKLWIHFNRCLKQLYIRNKTECFSRKGRSDVNLGAMYYLSPRACVKWDMLINNSGYNCHSRPAHSWFLIIDPVRIVGICVCVHAQGY